MAYSEDYRRRAIEYYETHTQKELYEAFKIYASEVNKWNKLLTETGSLEPKYPKMRTKKIDLEKLAMAVEEKPGAYLREHALAFGCTKQAVHYAMKKLKLSNKKNVYVP